MVRRTEVVEPAPADGATEAGLPQAFEPALSRLEALVGRMERGELTLEQALGAYEEGVALVRICQQRLTQAENQVRVLQDSLLTPWPDAGAAPAEDSGDD